MNNWTDFIAIISNLTCLVISRELFVYETMVPLFQVKAYKEDISETDIFAALR